MSNLFCSNRESIKGLSAKSPLIKVNEGNANSYSNEISSENMQKDSFYIFFQEMQDNTPQVIYIKNNKFDFFNQRGDYKNLTEYKIMEN